MIGTGPRQQTIYLNPQKYVLCSPPLLRHEFAKPDRIRPVQSGQDQTCSVQACRHVGMLACWHVGMLACRHVSMSAWRHVGWRQIFRNKFGKSGQDQTRSELPKFVTENGWLRVDFPSQIWEIWTGSDTIRAGCLRVDFPSRIWEIHTGQELKVPMRPQAQVSRTQRYVA